MKNGVVLYNSGWKCLIRVAVALHSLRKHWHDGVTLIMDGDDTDSLRIAQTIADKNGVEFMHTSFRSTEGEKRTLLNKTLMDEKTPYQVTVFLDADTVTLRPFPELFEWAKEYDVVVPQFASWKTKGKIRKRITAWKPVHPQLVKAACEYGPAINCGVYAWKHGSKFMKDWYDYALPGRTVSRIPDETCMQLLAPAYNYKVAPHWFNVSCKYDEPHSEEARIVHYHGNKHCRFANGEPVNCCDLWYKELDEIRDDDDYWQKLSGLVRSDRMLRKYMPVWDKWKTKGDA